MTHCDRGRKFGACLTDLGLICWALKGCCCLSTASFRVTLKGRGRARNSHSAFQWVQREKWPRGEGASTSRQCWWWSHLAQAWPQIGWVKIRLEPRTFGKRHVKRYQEKYLFEGAFPKRLSTSRKSGWGSVTYWPDPPLLSAGWQGWSLCSSATLWTVAAAFLSSKPRRPKPGTFQWPS